MRVSYRSIKSIAVSFLICITSCFLITDPAFAKDIAAGFGAGSTITTPTGKIAVENLSKGDRVLGLNSETYRQEANIIKQIDRKSVLSYYSINGSKIAGSNLIYKRTIVSTRTS